MVATISALGSVVSETRATANTVFPLTTTVVGRCVIVFCCVNSSTVNIESLSGGGVSNWIKVTDFVFTASPAAQTYSVFIGRVSSVTTGNVTATGSSSLAARTVGYSCREIATSAVSAGTSWVVESYGQMQNATSSQNMTLPTLVPDGSNRAYIGFCDPGGTATNTGITAGYTGLVEGTSPGMGNQWITNLSVSTSQSPIGRQGTSTTSSCMGLLIYATEADTTVATNLNIGSGSGKNHFKLQTAFNGYIDDMELSQANIIAGWNTDPQFRALPNGAVQFSVEAGGPGTGGTQYPRCELREMSTDGTTEFYFNANSGIHWIRGRSKITALPGASLSPIRQRVTIAQLHDSAAPPNDVGEVLTIFTQENTGTGLAELRLRVWDTGTNMPKFSTNYTVGDEFDWMIYVNAGYWAVYYGDLGTPAYDSIEYAADGNVNVFTGDTEYYFKAGCYPQINETFVPGDTLTTVELIYLRHWHTSWPTADPVTLPVTDEFIPFFGGV